MGERGLPAALAAAVDGRFADAQRAAQSKQLTEPVWRELLALGPLLAEVPPHSHRLAHMAGGWVGAMWTLVLCVAATKVVLALAGGLLPSEWPATAVPTPVFTITAAVFGGMGVVLIVGGRFDERARVLGWLDICAASFFTTRQIRSLADAVPLSWSQGVRAFAELPVEALAPAALWLFIARFPDAPAGLPVQRLARLLASIAVATGFLLVAAHTLSASGWATSWPVLQLLNRHNRYGYFFQLAFFTLPAAPLVLVAKTRAATGDERRRAHNLAMALAAGFAPIVLVSLLGSPWSPVASYFEPQGIRQVAVFVFAGLLSIPFTTAWAIRTSSVLDVRFFARAAVRAAATRLGIATVTGLWAGMLIRALYVARHRTLADLASETGVKVLLVLVGLGVWMVVVQPRLQRLVDVRLLRSRPAAADGAARVLAAARRARSVRELAEFVEQGIERLYQPEAIGVLVQKPRPYAYASVTGSHDPLLAEGALVHVLREAREPLTVGRHLANGLFHLLPTDEQAWVDLTGAHYLLPLRGPGDDLNGILLVGGRRGDLPFARDDFRGLAAVCEAAGVVLDGLLRPEPSVDAYAAVECDVCGLVSAEQDGRSACAGCGATLRAAPVPAVLNAKYRISRRLGRGGMGTVYSATDLRLGRDVAVKALHRVEAALVKTLRSEAVTAAKLDLPGIVQIYAIEEWRGVPILVMELMAGGTLADRLQTARIGPMARAQIGLSLCGTLLRLHELGVAHRDIKPANIGIRADGAACLLDLGLAGDAQVRPWERDQVGGTPSYIAPFIVAGSSDYARGDLWSLCQTLMEGLASDVLARGDVYLRNILRRAQLAAVRGDDVAATLRQMETDLGQFSSMSSSLEGSSSPE